MNISLSDQISALQALQILPSIDRSSFRLALRAVLVKSLIDQIKFDECYQDYWQELGMAVDSKVKQGKEYQSQQKEISSTLNNKQTMQSLQNWLHGKKPNVVQEIASYSPIEVLARKDFSIFTQEEASRILGLLHSIGRSLATRYSHRFKKSYRGKFDLRRTLRLNLRRGGEIMELAFRKQRIQYLKLVLLCDVSKSMDLYSRFLLQFIYGFQSIYRRVETFVFSTSLHRITDFLRGKAYATALEKLATEVPQWSGGTRIGESLENFVNEYGAKYLNKDSIVIIMSDGWDTGDISLLEQNMKRIHRSSALVLWLNPLAGNSKYEPSVKGMKAALPYIDVFVPVYNVDSLRELVDYLQVPKKSSRKHRLRKRLAST